MALNLLDPKTEYDKDQNLKRKDVELFMDWMNKQPHLPKINEVQAILFLQSCYFRNEPAKVAMDTYFTIRTLCPDLLLGRNPLNSPFKEHLRVLLNTPLQKKTPEGYTILFVKIMDPNPDSFNLSHEIKHLDMICMQHLHQEGTSNGHLILFDAKDVCFGHLPKFGPLTLKKFIFYLQEAMPLRLKGLHIFNIVPVMDKIVAIIKPFMKKELMQMLYLHKTVDEMTKFVPLECLPEEYGGNAPSLITLQEQSIAKLLKNTDFFEWEDTLLVNEKRRPGKPKNAGDFFGVEGTFKKLEID